MADWTSSVRSYLRETLLTVTGLPAVGYEGRDFIPTVGVPWLREQFIPTGTPIVTWGVSGFVQETFVYKLTLYSPRNSATRLFDHEDMVDAIRAVFYPGFTIRDQSSRYWGVVTQTDRGPTITEEDWIGTSVEVNGYFRRSARAA